MSNLQEVKEHDIQTGDFVEVRRLGGNIIIQVTDVLNSGIIHGEDVDGYKWNVPARRVVRNLRQ